MSFSIDYLEDSGAIVEVKWNPNPIINLLERIPPSYSGIHMTDETGNFIESFRLVVIPLRQFLGAKSLTYEVDGKKRTGSLVEMREIASKEAEVRYEGFKYPITVGALRAISNYLIEVIN